MDKASLIGSILGVVVCGATVMLVVSHGGNLMMFWSLKGVIMVFGGTISVLFMAMPMDKLLQVPGYIKAFFREPSQSVGETCERLKVRPNCSVIASMSIIFPVAKVHFLGS